MKILFEYADNEDTLVVIDYGKYVEVNLVIANLEKETNSVLFHGELNLDK